MDPPSTFESGNEHFDRIKTHLLNILALPVPLANLADASLAKLCSQLRRNEVLNELDRILSVLQTDLGVDVTRATEEAWTEDNMREVLLYVGSVFDDTPGLGHVFASGGYFDLSIHSTLSPQDVH